MLDYLIRTFKTLEHIESTMKKKEIHPGYYVEVEGKRYPIIKIIESTQYEEYVSVLGDMTEKDFWNLIKAVPLGTMASVPVYDKSGKYIRDFMLSFDLQWTIGPLMCRYRNWGSVPRFENGQTVAMLYVKD